MTIGTSAPIPARAHPARRKVLASYLEPIERWRREQSAQRSVRAGEIALGSGTLVLDAAEVELIVQLPPTDIGAPAESLALLAKSADDLRRLMTATSSTELYTAQAELMLNYALGAPLLAEVQKQVDALVAEGQVTQAKALSGLRHRLRHGLSEVNRAIAGSERERAEALSECLAGEHDAVPDEDPSARPLTGHDVMGRPAHDGKRRARMRARVVVRTGLSATALLAIALLLVTVLWLGPTVVPQALSSPPRVLTRSDFSDIAIVQIVQARPPSLFLQVDGTAWNKLDDAERGAIVQKVARRLTRQGYRGALIETTQGKPLAQWLVNRGGSLLDSVDGSASRKMQP